MKRSTQLLTAGLLAVSAATVAVPGAHALEQPVGGITPVASIYYEGMKHGEEVRGEVYYAPNGVPFAKTASGKVVVGDATDHAHTQTWILWTDRVEYLAPYSSTVSLLSHRGPNAVGGAIADKFLRTGGEAKYGRSTTPETTRMNGKHAGATPVQVQTFNKGEFHWTKATGARAIGGSIYSKWVQLGGMNALGKATTDEVTVWVNGKQFQQQSFDRGVIRWSKDTGAFRV